MKRISILSALLLMCAMTFAQQALWGGAPVVSPEIHDNNTVTFRLKAPKAVKVQVTGDFLPTQKIKTPFGEFDGPGVADLKENKDGVWEFTTPEPLKPELYSYTFLVDGLKINDPANVYMIRDVASVTNVFISVKAVLCTGVADIRDDLADDLLEIDIAAGGDLAHNVDQTGGSAGLAGHAGIGIVGQDLVQDRIGDLVADLVRMSLGDGLRSKQVSCHKFCPPCVW